MSKAKDIDGERERNLRMKVMKDCQTATARCGGWIADLSENSTKYRCFEQKIARFLKKSRKMLNNIQNIVEKSQKRVANAADIGYNNYSFVRVEGEAMLRKIVCFLIVTALLGLCLFAYATAEAEPLLHVWNLL